VVRIFFSVLVEPIAVENNNAFYFSVKFAITGNKKRCYVFSLGGISSPTWHTLSEYQPE